MQEQHHGTPENYCPRQVDNTSRPVPLGFPSIFGGPSCPPPTYVSSNPTEVVVEGEGRAAASAAVTMTAGRTPTARPSMPETPPGLTRRDAPLDGSLPGAHGGGGDDGWDGSGDRGGDRGGGGGGGGDPDRGNGSHGDDYPPRPPTWWWW